MQTKRNPLESFGTLAAGVAMAAILLTASVVWADPVVPGAATSAPAATSSATASGQPQQSLLGALLPFLVLFGIMYFLMIRPQQKKMKEHQSMLGELQRGDQVVTQSGFLGKVTGITDKVVTLELGSNCRVKMLKTQVNQIIKGDEIKEMA